MRMAKPARRRGVVMIITLLAIVLMVALVLFVLNLGQQVNRRIAVQDTADATAIAGSTWVARTLNTVAKNNVTLSRYIALVTVLDAFLRSHYLSNRVYVDCDHLVDAGQAAWNALTQADLCSILPHPKAHAQASGVMRITLEVARSNTPRTLQSGNINARGICRTPKPYVAIPSTFRDGPRRMSICV